MNRVHFAVAATIISTTMFAGMAAAQSTPSSLTPVLAGKKIVPPIRGEAQVEFTQPVTRNAAGKVTTTIRVKNASPSPIARLMVTETWYDGAGAIVAGGKGFINGLLQPGEIQVITIETPFNSKMKSNNWNFTHANGTVKVTRVRTLEDPDAAAKK